MLIIVEGVDCGGKTTLARAITDALRTTHPGDRVDQYHKAPPRQHPLGEYEVPLYHYRPGRSHHVVCDRWHVGEAIYPEVLERTTVWDIAVQRHIELFLQSRGALLVHVDPLTSVLRHRFHERGDDLISEHQLLDLRFRYSRYVQDTSLATWRITSSVTPFIIEKIITVARTTERVAAPLNPFVTYVGPPNPGYLLLGEVRHELRDTVVRARHTGETLNPAFTINNGPAFGPYPATSGQFLLKHMPDNLWYQSVGLANACDVDDVAALHATLGAPPIVALGRAAHYALSRLRLPAPLGAAPHPQYARRFLHGHGEEYGRAVAIAAVHGKNELSWRPKR